MSTKTTSKATRHSVAGLATLSLAAWALLSARAAVGDDQAVYLRAAAETVQGRYAAARADALELLRLQARDARAMALLIDVDFLGGRTAEARRLYARCTACVSESPVDPVTREAIVHGRAASFFRMLAPQLSEPYPDGPQPISAVREAARGRYGNALGLLSAMVKQQPTRPDLRFYRAVVFRGLGRRSEARDDLAVAVLFRPTLPDAGVPMPLDRLQRVSLWAVSALSPDRSPFSAGGAARGGSAAGLDAS